MTYLMTINATQSTVLLQHLELGMAGMAGLFQENDEGLAGFGHGHAAS